MFELKSNGGLGNEQVASIRLSLLQAFSNGLFFGFALRSIHHRNPGPWLWNWPLTEQLTRFCASRRSAPQASVFPVFRTCTQIGTQRISFNVSQHGQQVLVPFNRECLKATLIQMPRSFGVVVSMPTHRMRVCQPAEEFGELRVGLRLYYEMPMIGHDNIRINGKRNTAIRQSKYAVKGFIVTFLFKQGQSSNRSIDYMKASSRGAVSWSSWHQHTLSNSSTQNNELRPLFNPLPFQPSTVESRRGLPKTPVPTVTTRS